MFKSWIIIVTFGLLLGGAVWADETNNALNSLYDIKPTNNNENSLIGVFKKSRASVVQITSQRGDQKKNGSGFAVKKDGLIVTNAHVIKIGNNYADKIYITHSDWGDKIYRARLIKVAEHSDLALLKIDRYFANPLVIAPKILEVGTKVFALGNPDAGDGSILNLTFTSGIINSKLRKFKHNVCYQTTATINNGNSGGPLLDEHGYVVGINTFGLSNLENTFFAIRAEALQHEFSGFINGNVDYSKLNLRTLATTYQIQKPKLFAIIAADTDDAKIGYSVAKDLIYMKRLSQLIAYATGMPLTLKTFSSSQLTKPALVAAIKALRVSNNDAVIFYYSGHGFRYKQKKSSWPYLALKDQMGSLVGLDEQWIRHEVMKKRPRFSIVMVDCCNNIIPDYGWEVETKSSSWQKGARQGLKKLFLNSRGSILAASSVPGEFSIGGNRGGLFTLHFIKMLVKTAVAKECNWKIMKSSLETPLHNGKQHPQISINVTTDE